jgi:tRNA pseudouridine38-40 synthase
MRNIKLTIEYDGTAYHGWQSQINARAVQDEVNMAVTRLTGEDIAVIGASRTDQGVHALGQVCNFTTESSIPAEKFAYALNTLLPEDITVKASAEMDESFHSRFSAIAKKYRYLIYNSRHPSALLRHRACHVPLQLEFCAMRKAAGFLLGTHDFSAFRATGGNTKTAVRTITAVELASREELIEFEITGNGFLYNMVRIIAGTLIYVGQGKLEAGEVPDIIKSCDRKRAGKTAPAHGLYLVEVYY